jgi:hypothetical protein
MHAGEQEPQVDRFEFVVVGTMLISFVVWHVVLWIAGIRPPKRRGLWERLTWEIFPKDEETGQYLRTRNWIAIGVIVVTALVLYGVTELMERMSH